MNLLWLYQLHPFWLGVLIVGGFVAASLLGLRLTRPLARRLPPGAERLRELFLRHRRGVLRRARRPDRRGELGELHHDRRHRLQRGGLRPPTSIATSRAILPRAARRGAEGSAGLRRLRDPARVAGAAAGRQVPPGGRLLMQRIAYQADHVRAGDARAAGRPHPDPARSRRPLLQSPSAPGGDRQSPAGPDVAGGAGRGGDPDLHDLFLPRRERAAAPAPDRRPQRRDRSGDLPDPRPRPAAHRVRQHRSLQLRGRADDDGRPV